MAVETAEQPSSASNHVTKVKEGTAKRNITRKKTSSKDSGNYNSSHKKHGGHGKGQWNHEYEAYDVDPSSIDEKDPLYDAAQDSTNYVLTSDGGSTDRRGRDPATEQPVYGPLWTRAAFKTHGRAALREYFDSGDVGEVARQLDELGCREYHADVVKDAMSLSMDKGPREREMTSQLLTRLMELIGEEQESTMMEDGFVLLLDGLDELVKDVPEAKVSTLELQRETTGRFSYLFSF